MGRISDRVLHVKLRRKSAVRLRDMFSSWREKDERKENLPVSCQKNQFFCKSSFNDSGRSKTISASGKHCTGLEPTLVRLVLKPHIIITTILTITDELPKKN